MCPNAGKKIKNHFRPGPSMISVKAVTMLFTRFLTLPQSLLCIISVKQSLGEQYRYQNTCD